MCPQMACLRGCIVALVAFCLSFLHCVFSNVSSNRLHEWMHNRTGCICLAFLHYAFSNVSSNYLHVRMQNRTGSICSIFLPCGFSNDFGHFLSRKRQSHTGCTYLTFLHCLFLLLESAHWLHLTCVVQDSDPSPA